MKGLFEVRASTFYRCALYWAGWCIRHCRTARPCCIHQPSLRRTSPRYGVYATVELHAHVVSTNRHYDVLLHAMVYTPLSNCTPMLYPPTVTTTYFSTLWCIRHCRTARPCCIHQPSLRRTSPRYGVYATVELHAHVVSTNRHYDVLLHAMDGLLRRPKCMGVGEVGLDYYRHQRLRERNNQRDMLSPQLHLAVRHANPVCGHASTTRILGNP